MALSLYDVSVGSYLQLLGGVTGFLEKAREHFAAQDVDLNGIVETRLFEDMLPFRFQVISVAHHSLGAIRGIEAGVFRPPSMNDLDYAGLQRLVTETRDELEKYQPAQINDLEGKELNFEIGDRKVPFVAEDFVLSFSLPNFYFHATTAYDILRQKGAPLGKRDFTGRLRINS